MRTPLDHVLILQLILVKSQPWLEVGWPYGSLDKYEVSPTFHHGSDHLPGPVQGGQPGDGRDKGCKRELYIFFIIIFKFIWRVQNTSSRWPSFNTNYFFQEDEDGNLVPQPPRLQLSAEKIAMNGAYILDCGDKLILFIGKVTQPFFCEKVEFEYFMRNLFQRSLLDVWSVETSGYWRKFNGFTRAGQRGQRQIEDLCTVTKQQQGVPRKRDNRQGRFQEQKQLYKSFSWR